MQFDLRQLMRIGWAGAVGLLLAGGLRAAEPASAAATNAPAESAAPPRDLVAARYLTTCAGCHSLTGAKLTGPELTPSTAWPEDQLKPAIKKMESKVGPLPDEVVNDLATLLKAPDVRERLKAEGERMAAMFMAKMEPASADLGRQIFFGTAPLKNGGLACAACHVAAGQGGNLGPNLNGIFAKTGGELALVSAIEQSKYKIMEPHYLRNPVIKQEALHLAKYFSTLDPQDNRMPRPLFATVGLGGAVVMLAGLWLYLKQQRATRQRVTPLPRRTH